MWGYLAAIIALAVSTLGSGQAHAYDVATIQTYDLGKAAAHAERKQPVAAIAAKPTGGAYIQWATQTDWNGGDRGTANSQVYVTEVNNTGGVVSQSDIELDRSQPGGIVATDSSFGYYIWDGDKLTFGVGNPGTTNQGQTLVMDHRDKGPSHYDPRPTTFIRGFTQIYPACIHLSKVPMLLPYPFCRS